MTHGRWAYETRRCRCDTCHYKANTEWRHYNRRHRQRTREQWGTAPPGRAGWRLPTGDDLLWLIDTGDTVASLAGRYKVQPDSVRRAIRRAQGGP